MNKQIKHKGYSMLEAQASTSRPLVLP